MSAPAPAPIDIARRRLIGAPMLLSPIALAACAGRTPGRATDDRPPPLPAGLREGEQHPLRLPESAAAPYTRMQMAIPAGYAASTRPWPLLVFLHGAGERGTDIDDVKRGGPPLLAERGVAYPMLVCSPQVDPGALWQAQRLHALVAALRERFAIDPRRVLATGLSLGGSGAWRWACEFPGDLAAIAPVCGWVDPAAVGAMRAIPVRAYHGELDDQVPLARQQACVAELQRLGGTASLTIYPGVGHDSWTRAYQEPDLVPWLLAQRRGRPATAPEASG